MKSFSLSFLLVLTIFCVTSVAQSRATLNLDLRSDSGDSSGYTSSTRSAVVKSGNKSAMAPARVIEREIFALINAERLKKDLPELEWSENVAAIARLHSQDMANEKFFSHRGSDGSMVDDRADRVGLGVWRSIGENIAYVRGFDDPARLAVAKWLESASHRKNLLGPNWKETAVGVSITADGTCYVTEVFLLRK